jgi:hypothetical protein
MDSLDTHGHHLAHIRVTYADERGVFGIESAEPLEGNLPRRPLRLLPGWIEIHRDELMSNWALAIEDRPLRSIDPLR